MSLFDTLNPVQRDAVQTIDGPVMIVAGAGSGKTRVLTYRIAWLLEQGVHPANVLALTFTNKAAREMRERITDVIPGAAPSRLWMGTFHSTFARLLRRDAERIGYGSQFSIYDTEDSQGLIKTIMNEMGMNAQQVAPAAVRHSISRAKNSMTSVEEFTRGAMEIFDRKVAEIWAEYQKRLRTANAMDFDDLILKPIELFDQHPDVLERYQNQFRYILIDEYQDTNQAQYQIVRRLASAHRNICVVGDDAQSIYAFRGADIRNILEFEKNFEGVRVFRLEQNYRSTKNILQGAGSVINNNKAQIEKTLWTENEEGEPISVVETADEGEEAMKIVHCMQEESRRRKLQLSDFAVLYRSNAQSRALEDAMRRSGIPYTIVGGVEFYRRREIKDVLAYLRLLVNPADDDAFQRVVNFPARGIGSTTMQRLRAYAAEEGLTLLECAMRAAQISSLHGGAVRRLEDFVRLIQKFTRLREEMSAGELAGSLIDQLGLLAMYKEEGTMEARTRMDNVQELLSALAEYQSGDGQNTLEAFLAEAALVADVDALDQQRNTVTLMTMHAAKGLEFPVVFLAGVEEGLFPSSMSVDRNEVEEERRLCYVGMTRAMQKLYMTHARSRMQWGERYEQVPSRFLEEIDESVVQRESTRRRTTHAPSGRGSGRQQFPRQRTQQKRQAASEYSQLTEESYSQLDQGIEAGTRVIHATFGRGKIMSIQGNGDKARAVVLFESVGRKTLILKYAGLKPA